MTQAYQLKCNDRPQDIKKHDIKNMIKELEKCQHITVELARSLNESLEDMTELDLKKIYHQLQSYY